MAMGYKRYPQTYSNYKPVGQCIYCGFKPTSNGNEKSRERLGSEHTIPYSFGGNFVLPEASCLKCSATTSDFEHSCARTMFGPLRLVFALPTRRKKGRPKELPIEIERSGECFTIMVPIDEYPFPIVIFPKFQFPGMLIERPPTDRFDDVINCPALPAPDDIDARIEKIKVRCGGGPINIRLKGRTPLVPFARMLAKIAHAHAVAEFGQDEFEPFLPDYILGRNDALEQVVGCMDEPPEWSHERRDGTHEIFSGLVQARELAAPVDRRPSVYFLVVIRFFKDLNVPAYSVIVGVPTPGLIQTLLS